MNQSKAKEWLMMSIGSLLMSVGVYFFKTQNGFATGGVSGIGILLGKITTISSPTWIFILNVAVLFIGFIFLGKNVGIRTVYCSLLSSGLNILFEKICPLTAPLTDDQLLELIVAILLTASGSAIIFHNHGSSGGTDIIALILKKYTTLDIANALMIVDAVVALSSFFIFGLKIGILSSLGWIIHSFLIDYILEGFSRNKFFIIFTSNPDPIINYIIKDLNRSATIMEGLGAYSHEGKKVIEVVCAKKEAAYFQRKIKMLDPHSFTIITNSAGVIGHRWEEEDK